MFWEKTLINFGYMHTVEIMPKNYHWKHLNSVSHNIIKEIILYTLTQNLNQTYTCMRLVV
jgi:hypothetical protein